MVYVLLDGVGDLPHPDLDGMTPLQAARTPNLDRLAKKGVMGEVISVGRGVAPESDIAVFNMLGYKFRHADYVGRGVIEAIGVGIDFRDGDLALRGNFATLDKQGVIIDRRAGRHIEKDDAVAVAREIESKIRFAHPDTSVVVSPTVGHRITVRIRARAGRLSSNITNTDPAYARIDGMGIAKAVGDFMRIDKCLPLDASPGIGAYGGHCKRVYRPVHAASRGQQNQQRPRHAGEKNCSAAYCSGTRETGFLT